MQEEDKHAVVKANSGLPDANFVLRFSVQEPYTPRYLNRIYGSWVAKNSQNLGQDFFIYRKGFHAASTKIMLNIEICPRNFKFSDMADNNKLY
jgi:hypothetical protein